MKLSIILPVYNEADSLPELFSELTEVLKDLEHTYEVVAVNDGSRDTSLDILRTHARKDAKIKVVSFTANAGKTAAMVAGFDHATGDVYVTMDSDLQNDPRDIPKLLEKLDEGYDVVSGWRKERWPDSFVSRKIPSVSANWLISKVTKCPLHDYGCMLKVYKRETLEGVSLYGEMHRFVPAFASWKGARVAELPVNDRNRKFGKSNYGISRTFRVLLDLVLVRFLHGYMSKPMHFFGFAGLFSLFLGVASGVAAIVLKIIEYRNLVDTPLPTLSALLIIVGIQFIGFGVLAEILMRVYFESQRKAIYTVGETINVESDHMQYKEKGT